MCAFNMWINRRVVQQLLHDDKAHDNQRNNSKKQCVFILESYEGNIVQSSGKLFISSL